MEIGSFRFCFEESIQFNRKFVFEPVFHFKLNFEMRGREKEREKLEETWSKGRTCEIVMVLSLAKTIKAFVPCFDSF